MSRLNRAADRLVPILDRAECMSESEPESEPNGFDKIELHPDELGMLMNYLNIRLGVRLHWHGYANENGVLITSGAVDRHLGIFRLCLGSCRFALQLVSTKIFYKNGMLRLYQGQVNLECKPLNCDDETTSPMLLPTNIYLELERHNTGESYLTEVETYTDVSGYQRGQYEDIDGEI